MNSNSNIPRHFLAVLWVERNNPSFRFLYPDDPLNSTFQRKLKESSVSSDKKEYMHEEVKDYNNVRGV